MRKIISVCLNLQCWCPSVVPGFINLVGCTLWALCQNQRGFIWKTILLFIHYGAEFELYYQLGFQNVRGCIHQDASSMQYRILLWGKWVCFSGSTYRWSPFSYFEIVLQDFCFFPIGREKLVNIYKQWGTWYDDFQNQLFFKRLLYPVWFAMEHCVLLLIFGLYNVCFLIKIIILTVSYLIPT